MSIKGYPFIGKVREVIQDFTHATVNLLGSGQAGVSVRNTAYYLFQADAVVEAGSTDSLLVITANTIRPGDLIRFKITTNAIIEREVAIEKRIDANTVKFAGYLSDTLSVGDTVDVLRPTVELVSPTGSSLATVQAPPIQITQKFLGTTTTQTVLDDLDTPANCIPVPVKITGVAGSITIDAASINIASSHLNDSIAIGNGDSLNPQVWTLDAITGAGLIEGTVSVNDFGVSADAKVVDPNASGNLIQLTKGIIQRIIDTKDSIEARINTLGRKTSAGSTSVTISSDEGNIATSVENFGAANAAKEIDPDAVSVQHLPLARGIMYWVKKVSLSLPSVIGQRLTADSTSVTLSSDHGNVPISGNVNVSNQISGFATSAKQDSQITLASEANTADGTILDAAVTDSTLPGTRTSLLKGALYWLKTLGQANTAKTTDPDSSSATVISLLKGIQYFLKAGGTGGFHRGLTFRILAAGRTYALSGIATFPFRSDLTIKVPLYDMSGNPNTMGVKFWTSTSTTLLEYTNTDFDAASPTGWFLDLEPGQSLTLKNLGGSLSNHYLHMRPLDNTTTTFLTVSSSYGQ